MYCTHTPGSPSAPLTLSPALMAGRLTPSGALQGMTAVKPGLITVEPEHENPSPPHSNVALVLLRTQSGLMEARKWRAMYWEGRRGRGERYT